ncbi:SRPBCC family protein [Bradyrhizobium sp. 2TAF24]|uniref:SRPBCC family protein n=1 Tax=Bradyrhizobium sp. 2TAF24 TaxID=3233011 RepID=UPI003F8E8618
MTPSTGRNDVAEVTLSRFIAAPRARVWRAWTEAEHLMKWWGPNGFTTPVCAIDAQQGGALHIVMRGPDGVEYAMRGTYSDVVPPSRLGYTFQAFDADGRVALDGHTLVTFADDQGGTQLVIHSRATALVAHARHMLDGMEPGWTQTIDRLARFMTAP